MQLLCRRWDLPRAAIATLERFFTSLGAGHTSLELDTDEISLLASSPAVGDGTTPAPLVLSGHRLQSWRLYQAEVRVASRLRALAETRLLDSSVAASSPGSDELDRFFPDPSSAQRRAALLGMERSLALITGGPGTGKTTTAARLLALLSLRNPSIRVALAAPTGKAAARLGEAIGQAVREFDVIRGDVQGRLEQAGAEARTLHRLLRWNPRMDRCRYHEGNPLPYDVVVVDEASMLDLVLWDRLLSAVGSDTRLVVLGDHRQLESVQPGRVLGEMIEAATHGVLGTCHVELERNYRSEQYPGITKLAASIRNYDAQAALRTLHDEQFRGELHLHAADQVDAVLAKVWAEICAVVRAEQPAEALTALTRIRLLCAVRHGRYGVDGINAAVEARLRMEGLPTGERAHGRPVLITANDHHSGLFNGDVGVLMADQNGRGLVAWFHGAQEPRGVPLLALPEHETAWAMTVHRSQGSEFESVVFVLPPQEHELVGPELLYTGVTRARSRILLVADETALQAACRQRVPRRTGLRDQLGVASPP